MANSHISARLRYLQDSATSLSAASPETSAYLMSQANQLMFDNEIQPTESYRRHVCGACGSIMLPGWTSSVEKEVVQVESRRHNTRSKAANQSAEKKDVNKVQKNATASSMVYKCNLCRKNTKHRLPSYSTPASRRYQLPVSLPAKTSSNTTEKPATTSANMSSKKRARNRKQGGLQALLAAKKENNPRSGFGLDLMNLMKKA